MKFHIGTSGYQYGHWNGGVFYPHGVSDQLAFIYERLGVVEINSSFYSTPRPSVVANWAAKVPPGKKLILKCPQAFSHSRRLMLESERDNVRPGIEILDYFLEGYSKIPRDHQGPVLVQINDRQSYDLERLTRLLEFFYAEGYRVAFEARNESWLRTETYDVLERYNSALVAHDWSKYKCPIVETTDFVYVRKHGPLKMYTGNYSDAMLMQEICKILSTTADEAYVLFNNDGFGYAPKNAMRMMEMIE